MSVIHDRNYTQEKEYGHLGYICQQMHSHSYSYTRAFTYILQIELGFYWILFYVFKPGKCVENTRMPKSWEEVGFTFLNINASFIIKFEKEIAEKLEIYLFKVHIYMPH